jgi:hypothetical protein
MKYGFKVMGKAYGRGYKPDAPHYIMQKDSIAFVEYLREMGSRVMNAPVYEL